MEDAYWVIIEHGYFEKCDHLKSLFHQLVECQEQENCEMVSYYLDEIICQLESLRKRMEGIDKANDYRKLHGQD